MRATKESIAEQAPSKGVFARDRKRFSDLAALPFVASNVQEIVKVSHDQSREWELNISDNIIEELY
ncbi:hypothetical protein CLAFUW4_08337 [Fulvia fulva]|uniref:Uncharacterized protein n=1 Tax=Passalora fulva TaxID=5499 RepID=A0A9Q8LD86_PASFU|nr:uncharacterized protein CLAFUR5_08445 [Fulvia fulva]KAK4629067.1 hypothetical protein CLAFUR4_08342 [Fulvia fulva]KAK4630217.1 hypothetical protein CLAFUR0_08337 [Fulvia fulva]UJO15266.1 hypothetical protein CLAFUR5_08445 [Fulvia fulva]WPV12608.1 hypothetical protein CLAFUW4_08337 [Fulvia fulva]WPV27848.1 hypothetical protein CLAFUW7_08337 [Fulvia fulva]